MPDVSLYSPAELSRLAYEASIARKPWAAELAHAASAAYTQSTANR